MFLLCHSRDARTATSPTEDNLDILSGSGRHDPNALKVCGNHMIGFGFISINLRLDSVQFHFLILKSYIFFYFQNIGTPVENGHRTQG